MGQPLQPDTPSPAILAHAIQHCQFHPDAKRSAELLSGGFMWSDERPEAAYIDSENDYLFRFLIGFRASLIRGEPMEELRPVWDELQRLCPSWPGFRPERSDPALHDELKRELLKNCRYSTRALRHCEQTGKQADNHGS